ncbi:para-nitrobenzyl esterase isoform X3 [Nelusetta ayraudi]
MSEDVFEVAERMEYRNLVQDEDSQEPQYVRNRNYIDPLLVLSRRCIILICLAVLSLLFLATYLGYMAKTPRPGAALVTTSCGKFRGQHIDGAYSFKGMRYAAAPVGDLRWAPPTAPACGSGNNVQDAGHFGSMCAQVRPLSSRGKVMGQEDCLFANVWTPTLQPDAKLPVMVWIHGGYLHVFSGSEPLYSPTERLAADTDVVYVSFNYRLNAFGFLALEMLREGSPTNTSGNYGFMDQIAALKWVQQNIHVFGGDPEKVTIFGQSSGGTSVWTLMASPLAKGLFRAAVGMSSSYIYNATLEEADAANQVFLEKSGCRNSTCLRSLSIQQVLQAIPWEEYPSWGSVDLFDLPTPGRFVGPIAVVDGHVLEAPPFQVWEKGMEHSDVPLVLGTTQQEVDYYPPAENISTWTWDDYRWYVTDKLQAFGKDLPKAALELYLPSALCPTRDRCPERALTTMVSDIRVTCPNGDMALKAAAALRSPVYRYVVTHTPSAPVSTTGDLLPFPSRFSFHMLDVLAFFGSLEDILGTPLAAADRSYAELITHHLLTFAKTGQMDASWPQYPETTALLSDSLLPVRNFSANQCDLWRSNGFYNYAWIN